MTGSEGVVGALLHARKAADASQFAVRVEALPAAGEDLVGVGLVADIPDHLVLRRIVDVMECDGEFHRSETRCEVAGVHAEFRDHEIPYLRGERFQFGNGEPAQVFRGVDFVEIFVALLCHGRSVPIEGQRYPIITTF